MSNKLSILAGTKALSILRQEGLRSERIKVLAGASGAAKYLVLTGIDKFLFSFFKQRHSPLYLVGTSIGAFRMACYSHPNPLNAYLKLMHAYIHQSYPKRPTAPDVTVKSHHILNSFIDNADIKPIIEHPTMKLSFLSNRCKGLLASENKWSLSVGLLLAALTNFFSRDALSWFFERALFYVEGELPPFAEMNQFPMAHHRLTIDNFKKALLSSGSIPVIMQAVSDIPDIVGCFRDGGIVDYHLDIPFLPKDDDGLVLYPHFYDHITPGWFDKHTKRKPHPNYLENVVLISPTNEFVASLPYQKIPDRNDFKIFQNNDEQRIAYWNKVVSMSGCLGDELNDLIVSGNISNVVKPL